MNNGSHLVKTWGPLLSLSLYIYLRMALRFSGSRVIRRINGINLLFYPPLLPQPSTQMTPFYLILCMWPVGYFFDMALDLRTIGGVGLPGRHYDFDKPLVIGLCNPALQS